MRIVMTKTAETGRLFRGITLDEIEETISIGIKTIEKDGVLSTKGRVIVLYDRRDDLCVIKMVMSK